MVQQQNLSEDELLEKCWNNFFGIELWNELGDYAMDFHFSPLDSIIKECTLANLNLLKNCTLLNRINDSIPVSEITNLILYFECNSDNLK